MLIEQMNIEFELKGPGSGRTYTSKACYFYDKPKISKANLRMKLRILLKILQKAITLFASTWTKTLSKFHPKCKIFNVFWI